jgi:type I restriction enzyme M protein
MILGDLKALSEPVAQINCKAGLMFYQLLCTHQAQFIFEHDKVNIDTETFENNKYEDFCLEHLGFYISHDNLMSSWEKKHTDFAVSDVMDACNALNRLSTDDFKKDAGYIVGNFHSSLTQLGESTQTQTKTLWNLVSSIKELDISNIDDVNVELKMLLDNHDNQGLHSYHMTP